MVPEEAKEFKEKIQAAKRTIIRIRIAIMSAQPALRQVALQEEQTRAAGPDSRAARLVRET
jgi:hypothetical protein